tara:strand:- start:220 stop:591 length:372 start_codon:yes stop_codon:yes gene_type:complete
MDKYNHAFDIAFVVISNKKDGSDVTATMLKDALRDRIINTDDDEIIESCGRPFDTYKIKQKEEDFSVSFVWHIDDVLDGHPHLSKEQAKDVLLNCKKNHDATIGMNWEVINQTVEFLYPKETQ